MAPGFASVLPFVPTDILSLQRPNNFLALIEVSMPRFLFVFVLVFCSVSIPLQSQEQKMTSPGHYLFAWTGD